MYSFTRVYRTKCFLSGVGFEPTPSEMTATWTQRLRPLGHPDLQFTSYKAMKAVIIIIHYCFLKASLSQCTPNILLLLFHINFLHLSLLCFFNVISLCDNMIFFLSYKIKQICLVFKVLPQRVFLARHWQNFVGILKR